MKFTIITHAVHKKKENEWFSYAPYVREMQIWEKYTKELQVVAPISTDEIHSNELAYRHERLEFIKIKEFNITSLKNLVKSLFVIPSILIQIYKSMKWADHIHLRCPGNIGLLGCFVQILFPSKPKTAKYAGNWDPESKQPFTYKIQKWILSNTFLTKNMKVLVYGEWENQTKNILPFFTATYHKSEIEEINSKTLNETVDLMFVGALSTGKQPILSVKAAHELLKKGHDVVLNMYGEGVERKKLENYILENNLQEKIVLHGNVSSETVKKAFQKSHFLIFISKSEGWPKVVAEAMFWKCVPITTKVSCVPFMLGNGSRGSIVSDSLESIVETVSSYFSNKNKYTEHSENGANWSQNYTLEKFETEISKIL
ncbi:glycosyltransferase [Aureivirga sp. CE67]|uniref:glycosyltransferase n=1 Tax=Aureivirga sp. CE67 TaxID=1788983 RepID=UPI0018CA9E86|nr:glycosyltransferase [Aureivirga sp. CE67]